MTIKMPKKQSLETRELQERMEVVECSLGIGRETNASLWYEFCVSFIKRGKISKWLFGMPGESKWWQKLLLWNFILLAEFGCIAFSDSRPGGIELLKLLPQNFLESNRSLIHGYGRYVVVFSSIAMFLLFVYAFLDVQKKYGFRSIFSGLGVFLGAGLLSFFILYPSLEFIWEKFKESIMNPEVVNAVFEFSEVLGFLFVIIVTFLLIFLVTKTIEFLLVSYMSTIYPCWKSEKLGFSFIFIISGIMMSVFTYNSSNNIKNASLLFSCIICHIFVLSALHYQVVNEYLEHSKNHKHHS